MVSSTENDTGGQYDSTMHHYDRLELVEHKDGQELSNPHYYNVSIKDVSGKIVSSSTKDEKQHQYDTGGQNDSTSNHYDRLEQVERKGTCDLLNPCYYDEKNRAGNVKSQDDAKTKPLPDTDEEEQDYDRGGQYDPATNHYDRLELVAECKETHEVSTQHYYEETNRDGTVKSQDNAKTMPRPDTDKKNHDYETCTAPKKPLPANGDTKASVDGVKDTTDARYHKNPSKETIIHDIDNETNQKQVPEYAVVDKTKKTSRMKHDENSCTDPTIRSGRQ